MEAKYRNLSKVNRKSACFTVTGVRWTGAALDQRQIAFLLHVESVKTRVAALRCGVQPVCGFQNLMDSSFIHSSLLIEALCRLVRKKKVISGLLKTRKKMKEAAVLVMCL